MQYRHNTLKVDGLRFFNSSFVRELWRDLLICLWLLTSPKSIVSMVNWLADFRFDLDYKIAYRIRIKFSRN